MKYLKTYNNFKLNEALGLAEPITFYLNRLTYLSIKQFYEYVESVKDIKKDDAQFKITLDNNYINSMLPKRRTDITNEYLNFPLSEIVIYYNFYKELSEDMGTTKNFKVGGAAYSFAKGNEKTATRFKPPTKSDLDHSLSIQLEINIYYGPYFKMFNINSPLFEKSKLFKKVESVIAHELNHLYEYYNRKLNHAKPVEIGLSLASINPISPNIPNEIFNFWEKNFSYYIYASEEHEINAQTQEAQSFISKISFDNFKRNKLWKDAKIMSEWKYKTFINDFNKEFLNDEISIEEMKKFFIQSYKNEIKEFKENPALTPEKLERMTIEQFFIYFEKKINNGGNKLIRNFYRLFSLKIN